MAEKASSASGITEMLRDLSDNHRADSADAVLKTVYAELHRQAHRYWTSRRQRAINPHRKLLSPVFVEMSRIVDLDFDIIAYINAICY